MGADFTYATCPRIEPTPQRLKELRRIVKALTPQDLAAIADQRGIDEAKIAGELRKAISKLSEIDSSRDVSTIARDGRYDWITGGLSWGDPPTDAYELFCLLTACGYIECALETWAKEDLKQATA